jgi:hypothetical protein
MNEAIAMQKASPSVRRPLEVVVEGKIVSQRRHENRQYTVIRCAAADEYSHPSTLEVRSAQRLGDVDEVVKLEVRVSGTLRSFAYTDKNTGESRKGNDGRVYFDVIE